MGYQERDWEIVDYQMYSLKDTGLFFRGAEPNNLEKNKYFVCIGAAQTLGCFCQKPFPSLLEKKLNLPVLNLGYGGAGPYFYLKEKSLISYINRAKFAIIQVMSGRSESNSVFDSGGLEHLTKISDGTKIGADDAYGQLLKQEDINYVKKIVAETRANWLNNFQKLLQQIEVPKILLWFSNRHPYYKEKYSKDVYQLFGGFPQLVNLQMVNHIKQYSDEYVECISNRGRHQLLVSRFTGKPIAIDPSKARADLGSGKLERYNKYYPSPEMQVDAAYLLEKVCGKYL